MGGRTWLPFPVLLLSALLVTLLRGAAGFTPSLDSDFTFTLPAGRKECFYQPMPLKGSLEIEYQVSAGVSRLSLGRAAPHGHFSPAWKTCGRRPRGIRGGSPGKLGAGVQGEAPGILELKSLATPKMTSTLPLPFPLVGKGPALVTSVALLFF